MLKTLFLFELYLYNLTLKEIVVVYAHIDRIPSFEGMEWKGSCERKVNKCTKIKPSLKSTRQTLTLLVCGFVWV